MQENGNLWGLVLAAGDGRRLQALTTTEGLAVPKQFCTLRSGPSLLSEALQRAREVTAPQRICTIVAEQHRRFWLGHLDSLRAENVIVQPRNRGTAHGILLPLLRILEVDPAARILVLPSDHYVRDEAHLAFALREAAELITTAEAQIVLLGARPRSPDTGLGYILPCADGTHHHHGVLRFVEKPDKATAQSLLREGALWNMFIIAAEGHALLALFERRYPEVVQSMTDALRGTPGQRCAALDELYEALPELDFSRDILQGQEQRLRVLAAPECGWSDLGTPARVIEALGTLPTPRVGAGRGASPLDEGLLSLAERHRFWSRAADPQRELSA